MENLSNALDEVIRCIKNSPEYIRCMELKTKMTRNEEITSLVEKVKVLQKKYVKSNYDQSVKKELDSCLERLGEIPLYQVYLDSLEKVNYKIDYVRDSLNEYFDSLLNQKY